MSEMCEQSASTLHETSDDKTTATEPNGNSTKSERAALKMDSEWEEYHGKLLRMVKKEVKHIMEEAVTRKFVHEDSGSITSLCTAVDACLSHGLKRRALGLFKTNSTTALLQKVAKNHDPAARIYRNVMAMEKSISQRSSSSSDSQNRANRASTKQTGGLLNSNSSVQQQPSVSCNIRTTRHLWIRLALIEKQLYFIVEHLVQNALLYYEREALVADKVCGQLLASLLVGPCALDYSRMRSQDQLWNDLPADELVQRHYLVNGPPTPLTPPTGRRAPLHLPQQRRHVGALSNVVHPLTESTTSLAEHASVGLTDSIGNVAGGVSGIGNNSVNQQPIASNGCGSTTSGGSSSTWSNSNRTFGPFSPKEYVESLHQNCRSTLLYGKNNVWVQPKEDMDPLPGYLSLHQTQTGLEIRWTPNQLMNGSSSDENNDKSVYWNYALNVRVDDVVYLHCHQEENGGVIVFVGQDGIQRSPIRFPKGSHLLAFLSCLENGLQPNGQLDPPLWIQKGKGKVFPRLKKKARQPVVRHRDDEAEQSEPIKCDSDNQKATNQTTSGPVTTASAGEQTEQVRIDYVFRIITSLDKPDIISEELFNPKASVTNGSRNVVRRPQLIRAKLVCTSSSGSSSSSGSCGVASKGSEDIAHLPDNHPHNALANRLSDSQQSAVGSPFLSSSSSLATSQPIQIMCESMKKQIVARAFYGWLAYCRHLQTVRTHLSELVQPLSSNQSTEGDDTMNEADALTENHQSVNNIRVDADENDHKPEHHRQAPTSTTSPVFPPLDESTWQQLQDSQGRIRDPTELLRRIYFGSCEHRLRHQVWPFLLGHYPYQSTREQRSEMDCNSLQDYELLMSEWLAVEAIVKQRDKESLAANLAKLSSGSSNSREDRDHGMSNEVFTDEEDEEDEEEEEEEEEKQEEEVEEEEKEKEEEEAGKGGDCDSNDQEHQMDTEEPTASNAGQQPNSISRNSSSSSRRPIRLQRKRKVMSSECSISSGNQILITNPSVDSSARSSTLDGREGGEEGLGEGDEAGLDSHFLSGIEEKEGQLSAPNSSCVSPASSNGGVYSTELLDLFSLNLHRIDKDVQRCDRNYAYFTNTTNLEKLRNVMCTYVWQNLQQGYVQGMCDLVAPFLVVFNDEMLSYSCFCELMKRMSANFPYGGAMDTHFANMRSLIQILDPELFELMHSNGDYTHFYFCYRWFLLDFKREFCYDDVFKVWEMIWSGRTIASSNLVLFIALALVQMYREIIIENNMDFTDVIKFFNEMAERHDASAVLKNARDLVLQIQQLIC